MTLACVCVEQTSVEMSVYNVLCYFSEIETGKPYQMRSKNEVYR